MNELNKTEWRILLDNYLDCPRSTRLKFIKIMISIADKQKQGEIIDRNTIADTLQILFKGISK
tara:strand:- start:332 stop:520 length:189 start_codon:yes stop_codon:yes gene_type:complete